MKKTAILLSLSLLAASLNANAQKAFENLSFGLEAGTNGVGVELAMPVITDHVMLVAGFNAPTLAYPVSETESLGELNGKIEEINNVLSDYQAAERIETRFSDITLSATPMLNLSTAKVLLELYPFKKVSFHITAGAYFGMGDNLMSVDLSTDEQFWSDFKSLQSEVNALNAKYGANGTNPIPGYQDRNIELPAFALGNTIFEIDEKDNAGHLAAEVLVSKIRPYVGIGFGRSVPRNKHWGLQFDLGLLYHGNPELVSDNIVESTNAEVIDLLADVEQEYIDLFNEYKVFYPHVSFKLVYKIF